MKYPKGSIGARWATEEVTLGPSPQCHSCKHFDLDTLTCYAFPEGVPMEILSNRYDHREPYPSDNGVQYDATSSR